MTIRTLQIRISKIFSCFKDPGSSDSLKSEVHPKLNAYNSKQKTDRLGYQKFEKRKKKRRSAILVKHGLSAPPEITIHVDTDSEYNGTVSSVPNSICDLGQCKKTSWMAQY